MELDDLRHEQPPLSQLYGSHTGPTQSYGCHTAPSQLYGSHSQSYGSHSQLYGSLVSIPAIVSRRDSQFEFHSHLRHLGWIRLW